MARTRGLAPSRAGRSLGNSRLTRASYQQPTEPHDAVGLVGSVEPVAQKPKCFWVCPAGMALTQLGSVTVTVEPLRVSCPFHDCVIGTFAGSWKRNVFASLGEDDAFVTAMPAQ